ncbi:MAG: AraC family transcriptional regulator, partial [SAR86 cluster bacterium]
MDWIYKVIEYVEDNLKNSMTIEDIAAVSGYSERHFQRVFRERTADSIMDYIRGRRLTLAMEEIISSQKSIIDIAFEYQFESQQNFTRAFQSRFMFPPRRFRNNELHNPPSAKKRLTEAYLGMIAREELTLEPEIIQKKEKIFIG